MEEGEGGGGKVKRNILKIVFDFFVLIQTWVISADVEVGQGGQLGRNPPGSPLLCPLRRRPEDRRNFSHKKS